MVEGRQVGHFHHHGGFEHVLTHRPRAIIRRQQRKHWAETLTTSFGQVHHLLLKKVWTFFQLYPQPLFNVFHAAKNMFVEGVIAQINARADGGIATVLTNYGSDCAQPANLPNRAERVHPTNPLTVVHSSPDIHPQEYMRVA